MGYREWLRGLGNEPERKASDGGAVRGSHFGAWNDVEARSEAIQRHYEGIDDTQARQIAELLVAELTEGGYSLRTLADDVVTYTGLGEDDAFTIVRTETAAMQNLRRVQAYAKHGDAAEQLYQWTGPDDRRTSAICTSIKREIEAQGGAVPVGTLQELIREHAAQHEDGTPERAPEFLPHRNCRHVPLRYVDP